MRCVLIGPTYPFRGGISHYTTLLCQNLRQRHEVDFYTFTRQYPTFLFPGKTDKDPSKAPLHCDATPLIDPVNPLVERSLNWGHGGLEYQGSLAHEPDV